MRWTKVVPSGRKNSDSMSKPQISHHGFNRQTFSKAVRLALVQAAGYVLILCAIAALQKTQGEWAFLGPLFSALFWYLVWTALFCTVISKWIIDSISVRSFLILLPDQTSRPRGYRREE